MTTLTSQNGYSAGDPSLIVSALVPGTTVIVPVRKGPAGQLLIAAAARWHREVEPLVPGTCWGYAFRSIRGSSTELSNHASGTAIDVNAPQHPLGTNPAANFSQAQIAAIHGIVDTARGALRWGGDYGVPARGGVIGSRPDGMHLEVNASEAACTVALKAFAPTAVAVSEDPLTVFTWPAGAGAYKLVCPVGAASAVTAAAWLSLACDGVISHFDVWCQGDKGGLSEQHGALGKDQRGAWQLPDGCTQVTVHYVATGPVGACIETKPK